MNNRSRRATPHDSVTYSSWADSTSDDEIRPVFLFVSLIQKILPSFLLQFLEKVEIPASRLRIDRMRKVDVLSEKSVDAGSHTIAVDSLVMIRQDLLIECLHLSLDSSSLASNLLREARVEQLRSSCIHESSYLGLCRAIQNRYL